MASGRQRLMTSGDRPGPSDPRRIAVRGAGLSWDNVSLADGVRARTSKPRASSASTITAAEAPSTKGVRSAAPTETRIAFL
ncbi:hypothetical protein D3C72_1692380 [compost metagenome]